MVSELFSSFAHLASDDWLPTHYFLDGKGPLSLRKASAAIAAWPARATRADLGDSFRW